MAKTKTKPSSDRAAMKDAKRGNENDADTVAVIAPQSEPQRSCNDILFAVIFLAALGFTIALAIMYGQDVLASPDTQDELDTASDFIHTSKAKYKYALRICAGIAGGTLLASLLWTVIMLVCGKMLIWMSLIVICATSVGAGFFSSDFLHKQGDKMFWWPIAVSSLFATLVMIYVCCIRNRIAFASANLQVACKSVLSYPVIMVIAILFTFVQIAWALVWILGTYATINHGEYLEDGLEFSTTKKFGILVVMLVIFFWGTFVCRNIVMVSTSGTVASWWRHSTQDRRPMTTTKALSRALTLSFGSICFGSLIVSIIQTIRVVLEAMQYSLQKSGNSVAVCLLGCLECMVGCIQRAVEYFNRFAYAYMGIYGYSFVSSGKRVFQLFSAKGWSAIANDSLIVNVLLFGKIVVGFVGAAAGWGCVVYGDPKWTVNVNHPKECLGLSGFLIGYSIADVIMTVVDGAVATIFILFAEDPDALVASHPSSHEALHTTWSEIHPEEYARANKRQDGNV